MDKIKLEFEPAIYHNLRALVIAGAKAPMTDEMGLHAGSQLLLLLDQQVTAAAEGAAKERAAAVRDAMPKPVSTNGRDAQAEALAH